MVVSSQDAGRTTHGLDLVSTHASHVAAWPPVTPEALVRHIAGLAAGERLTVLGLGRDGVGDLLAEGAERSRGALLVACDAGTAAAILDRLLQDLAELALAGWPPDEPSSEDETPPDPWRKAAAKCVRAGRPPRFRRMARKLEFARLLGAVEAVGPVLVWEVDPASGARAAPVIEALEWCARHGAAVVAALPADPPLAVPYDRILYGAVALARPSASASARFIAPMPGAHHASLAEQRVAAALARDADLAGLFQCNVPVPVGAFGERPRVDLLCPAHRIVVELDGPEHRAEAKFAADRHRDYTLLTSGYLILRLTNEQVAADLPLAIEKIRAVVDLRRRPQEETSR